jgi:hypothetical protein
VSSGGAPAARTVNTAPAAMRSSAVPSSDTTRCSGAYRRPRSSALWPILAAEDGQTGGHAQRHAGLHRERRVTAGEDQPEPLVVDGAERLGRVVVVPHLRAQGHEINDDVARPSALKHNEPSTAWAATASPPPSRSTACGRHATRTRSTSTMTATAGRNEPGGSRHTPRPAPGTFELQRSGPGRRPRGEREAVRSLADRLHGGGHGVRRSGDAAFGTQGGLVADPVGVGLLPGLPAGGRMCVDAATRCQVALRAYAH